MPHEEVSVSELVGPYGWGIMEYAAKTFPCPPCAEEGIRLVQFDRDFVELKIGKKPQNPQNFLKVLEEAQRLAEKRGILTRSRIREVLGPFADLPGKEIKGGILEIGPVRAGNPHNPGKRFGKPFALTDCEKKNPGVVAKIERCSRDVAKDPSVSSPIAVCRASISCP